MQFVSLQTFDDGYAPAARLVSDAGTAATLRRAASHGFTPAIAYPLASPLVLVRLHAASAIACTAFLFLGAPLEPGFDSARPLMTSALMSTAAGAPHPVAPISVRQGSRAFSLSPLN